MPGVGAIAANLAAVRAEIAAACARSHRDPEGVRLIAVTKEHGPEVLPELRAAGVADIGENRLEHLELMHAAAPPGTRIHAIGRVQGRQLAKLAPLCAALHSLCDEDHILRLGRACAALGKRLPVFLQVNTAADGDKAGMAPGDLPRRLDLARAQAQLEVVGLMTMAPLFADGQGGDAARRCFAALRVLAVAHGLPRLSMGMSGDFTIAIEEGATEVRIGRRLFA
jgi:hypothetical protein